MIEERGFPVGSTRILPEGCLCEEAFPGLLSLGFDILRNEAVHLKGERFTTFYIDSGTGGSAAALIAFMMFLRRRCRIVVCDMVGDEPGLWRAIEQAQRWLR